MNAQLAGYDRAWRVLRRTLGPLVRLLLRPRVVGRRNVPVDGPVLIVSNHESWWDIPALGWSQPRSIRYMAKRELYGYVTLAWLLRWGGAFPVRRGEPDRDALRTRARDGRGRRGGGHLHPGPPPGGARRRQGRRRPLRGRRGRAGRARGDPGHAGGGGRAQRISIVFGEPRTYERGDRRPGEAYRETADELMAEIRRLYETAG